MLALFWLSGLDRPSCQTLVSGGFLALLIALLALALLGWAVNEEVARGTGVKTAHIEELPPPPLSPRDTREGAVFCLLKDRNQPQTVCLLGPSSQDQGGQHVIQLRRAGRSSRERQRRSWDQAGDSLVKLSSNACRREGTCVRPRCTGRERARALLARGLFSSQPAGDLSVSQVGFFQPGWGYASPTSFVRLDLTCLAGRASVVPSLVRFRPRSRGSATAAATVSDQTMSPGRR